MLKSIILFPIKIIGKQNIGAFLRLFSSFTRNLAYFAHWLQKKYDWKVPPQPEWFDHYCDQFYLHRKNKAPLWVERGIFGLLAMKKGAEVLELCCGDGYNSCHFYSSRAKNIISVDFDKLAIPHAKRYNQMPNIDFRLIDIRYEMPQGQFDNIVWDAAIEHFTVPEIDDILKNIKARLKPDGVVTGYTMVEREDGVKQLSHHEYEFKSKEDLRSFFEPHFKNVKVFETMYPLRHNLYFFASNSVIPFDDNWQHQTTFRG
jgi:2-polyprenyl-3-methyl-5-hydroxy-6-metoxy-1,4-benzoquinol methylase